MDMNRIAFAGQGTYPPVEVHGKDPKYARAILSNIGSCNSEISAVSLYFYDSLVTRSQYSQVSECFHRISLVEMHHLDLFGELACLLGADPRLWSYSGNRLGYWTPRCNQYPRGIRPLLSYALSGERAAVEKYRQQTSWIQDRYIVELLDRIILDEETHIDIFQQLLEEFPQEN